MYLWTNSERSYMLDFGLTHVILTTDSAGSDGVCCARLKSEP